MLYPLEPSNQIRKISLTTLFPSPFSKTQMFISFCPETQPYMRPAHKCLSHMLLRIIFHVYVYIVSGCSRQPDKSYGRSNSAHMNTSHHLWPKIILLFDRIIALPLDAVPYGKLILKISAKSEHPVKSYGQLSNSLGASPTNTHALQSSSHQPLLLGIA